MQDLKYWIWLSKLNLNPRNIRKYLEKNDIKDLWNCKEEKLNTYFIKEEIKKILKIDYRKNLKFYEQYMKEHHITLLTIKDEEYPNKLKNIYDAPITLYLLGNNKLINQQGIAVVGSRTCSDYGEMMSKAFSYSLAKRNLNIISGLAIGIDSSAHKGALLAKGKTIAIIGTGIDLIYPKENQQLFYEIVKNDGLIISEYSLGTKPIRENFPKRNRIISALSDGVLVIEAGEKSGALITVDYALEYGKNIYVVPREYNKHKSQTVVMN